jgi:N,N-dimethylformamidase
MLGIVGYSDRIYCRPGDTVNFKVSCESVASYDAEVVRLVCGDDNPKGPGVKELAVKTAIDGHYEGHRQKIHAGSYAVVLDAAALRGIRSFTMQAFVWPTTPAKGTQGIFAKWSPESGGFALIVDDQGAAALRIGDESGGVETVSVGRPMLERHWYRVGASFDAERQILRVFQYPLRFDALFADGGSVERTVGITPAENNTPLVFAALPGGPTPDLTFTTTVRLTALVWPIGYWTKQTARLSPVRFRSASWAISSARGTFRRRWNHKPFSIARPIFFMDAS